MRTERVESHTFLSHPLGPNSVVLDCGSNRGLFSRWIVENLGCQVHGFEPDPRFYERLPHELPRCTFHPYAVSDARRTTTLHLGESLCSSLKFSESNAATVEVEALTLEGFCDEHGVAFVDLLKLDVEGEELPILEALSPEFVRDRVGQMTIEFHDHKDASARPRIEKIMERIRGFGLHVYPMSRHTYGDVVVVNPAHVAFGPEERARLVALKYTRGIRRAIGRRLGTYP